MPITAFYAGLLTLLFVILSVRVIRVRVGSRISVGDGDDGDLLRRIRVHGNFAEYAPLALVLIGLAESLKTNPRYLHGLGLALLVGRLVHAIGLSPAKSIAPLRITGMVLTFGVLIAAAILCIMSAMSSVSFGP